MLSPLRSTLAALALLPAVALAQTPADAPAAPAATAEAAKPAEPPKPPPWYTAVTLSGQVDAFYQVRLDAAQDAPVALRAFDGPTGFNLGYAKISAAMAPAPAGFRLDLGFGPVADGIDLASSFSAGTFPAPTAAKYVQQAYAAMKLGPAEVNVGRFATSAGAEVVEAKDNWLYSRSIVFFLEPITHTGLRVTIPAGETFSLTLGVNNGWDVVTSNRPGKTGQVSVAWTGPAATLAVNVYVGENPTNWLGAPNTNGQIRTFVDAVLGTTIGPLGLNANFDWGTEAADAYWAGALMARFTLPSDVARITGRFAYAKDLTGNRFLGVKDATVWEGTAGLSVPVGSNSELRVEGRYDKASEQSFNKGSPTDSQLTGTVAAIAWF